MEQLGGGHGPAEYQNPSVDLCREEAEKLHQG